MRKHVLFAWTLSLAIGLGGCATPDVKPFATGTADLAAAAESERKLTLDAMNDLITGMERLKTIEENPWTTQHANWVGYKKSYISDMKVVQEALSEAVAYSEALVDLAEAGETGGEAVKSLAKTIDGFATVASVAGAGPLGGVIGSTAKNAAVELGQAWTRVQAQESLAKAMAEVARPDGAADKLSKSLETIFSEIAGKLATGINDVGNLVAAGEAGDGRISFYSNLAKGQRVEGYFLNVADRLKKATGDGGICVKSDGDADPNCISGQELRSLSALLQITQVIEPAHKQYYERMAANRAWLKTRLAKQQALVAAVKSWKKEHQALADRLNRCGGFRALRYSCGNLTAANLKLAIEKVKSATQDDAR